MIKKVGEYGLVNVIRGGLCLKLQETVVASTDVYFAFYCTIFKQFSPFHSFSLS